MLTSHWPLPTGGAELRTPPCSWCSLCLKRLGLGLGLELGPGLELGLGLGVRVRASVRV